MKSEFIKLPVDRLPKVQKEVYQELKKQGCSTAQNLATVMNRSLKPLTAILRLLRKKELVIMEGLEYRVTHKNFFMGKSKEINEELIVKNENIQDQLEWNRKILQRKALRELRMRINL